MGDGEAIRLGFRASRTRSTLATSNSESQDCVLGLTYVLRLFARRGHIRDGAKDYWVARLHLGGDIIFSSVRVKGRPEANLGR